MMAGAVKNLIIAGLLLYSSIRDIRYRRIRLYPVLYAGIALILCAAWDGADLGEAFGGMAAGGCVLLISRATKGKIGEGDACVLCVTGIGTGLVKNLEILCIGFFLAAILSGILFMTGKAGRNTRLPFIPFLLAGYLLIAPV